MCVFLMYTMYSTRTTFTITSKHINDRNMIAGVPNACKEQSVISVFFPEIIKEHDYCINCEVSNLYEIEPYACSYVTQ